MYTLVRKDDEEPLIVRKTKTSRSSRVGMFLFVFLFVGVLGSALIYKQQSAPITDVAVGTEAIPKLGDTYTCPDGITAADYFSKMTKSAQESKDVYANTKKFRDIFECSKDLWKKEDVKENGDCTHSLIAGYTAADWAINARDYWNSGIRKGYGAQEDKFVKIMKMCTADAPLCKSNKCEKTGNLNKAGLVIDVGSGGTRPTLMLYTDENFEIETYMWPDNWFGYDGCQLIANKDEDTCLGDLEEFNARFEQILDKVFQTVDALKMEKIEFALGGVTAGGRNQVNTGQGGVLFQKLDGLKNMIQKRAPKVRTVIRMITGQEEAYYAWLDANLDNIIKDKPIEQFTNTFERGGASSQFTLTVKKDVNAYEDVYNFNLFGRDYYVWADSLVAGGQGQLWSAFLRSVEARKDFQTKKAASEKFKTTSFVKVPLVDSKAIDSFQDFLGYAKDFLDAQKGLCGDIALKELPCPEGAETCTHGGQMVLGSHDTMSVQMEQRWTGLCVAGVKIPEYGIASLDIPPKDDKQLIWTATSGGSFKSMIVDTLPFTASKCKKTTSIGDADMKDYLASTSDYKDLLQYYTKCFIDKDGVPNNMDFLVALFYSSVFKRINEGIKKHWFKTAMAADAAPGAATEATIEPYKGAKFTMQKGSIEWLNGAAWMQVYNDYVHENFNKMSGKNVGKPKMSTKKVSELIDKYDKKAGAVPKKPGVKASTEEAVAMNMYKPVDSPGTLLDLETFEH